jgi:enoyl-CoA hydratase/carnithine racemase
MAYETVDFEVRDDGIATMTLNRPKLMNCFNRTMFSEWRDIVAKVAYDDAIRVLVVTGAGPAFSSGVDLNVIGSEKQPPAYRFYYRENHQGFDDLEAVEKPVIAAINGICFGGGVELALSCDIRIAAEDSTYCLIENQLNAIPASGACNRMIHYVGLGRTKELVMRARPIDAQEAWRIGLVDQVVPADALLEKTYEYAEGFLDLAPHAVGMSKHVINMCLNTDMHTGRYIERLAQSVLSRSEDHREGMAAFFEKRKPDFKGR